MVRSAILLCLAGALALLYWSVFVRLLPITSEHRDKALEMSRTADEVERLRARWTPQQTEEIKQRHAHAQQALFVGDAELKLWQEEVQEHARMRVLEADLKVEEAKALTGSTDPISSVSARLDIYPSQIFNSTNSSYRRLLAFTDAIANSGKRLELLELSVHGNSNSVSQAEARVQLLSTERPVQ